MTQEAEERYSEYRIETNGTLRTHKSNFVSAIHSYEQTNAGQHRPVTRTKSIISRPARSNTDSDDYYSAPIIMENYYTPTTINDATETTISRQGLSLRISGPHSIKDGIIQLAGEGEILFNGNPVQPDSDNTVQLAHLDIELAVRLGGGRVLNIKKPGSAAQQR